MQKHNFQTLHCKRIKQVLETLKTRVSSCAKSLPRTCSTHPTLDDTFTFVFVLALPLYLYLYSYWQNHGQGPSAHILPFVTHHL